MSLEASLSSKKVTLGPGAQKSPTHSQKSQQQQPSAESSPSKSPLKSRLSLKGLGRSSTSAKGSRSPIRRQQTVSTSGEKDKKSKSQLPTDLGEYIPGTSGPAFVDHSPFYDSSSGSSGQKQSAANKIITNWKSACKDKTKDFIRKWKTLPENHPDFDQLPSSSSAAVAASSNDSSATTKNKSPQGSGSSTNIYSTPQQLQQSGSNSSTPTPTLAFDTTSASTVMVNPNQTVGGGSGGGGGASNSGGSGSSSSTLGKFTKNLTNKKGESSDAGVVSGFQAMSLGAGGRSGGGSFGGANANGPYAGSGGDETKSSTGWSVHVWATYVQRDVDDVSINEDKPPARDFLSDFQKVKLAHFFRTVMDMNHDDVISAEDFVCLNQRIRHYIEWSSECIEFHILKEVHSGFLECFLNQPLDDSSRLNYCNSERETKENVTTQEWLDLWGSLLKDAKTLESLPLWLQYFPKILFQVINKSGSGTISKEELRAFYTMFLGIDFRIVNDTLDSIFNAMTDSGRNKISYTLFKLCFANFLLGKFPHGPGQYLFGICAPATLACSFPIDYSALNTPKDDLEPYDPEKGKEQSNRRLE